MSSQTIYRGYPTHDTYNPFDSLSTTSDTVATPLIYTNFPRQEETPTDSLDSKAKIVTLIPDLPISESKKATSPCFSLLTRIKNFLCGDDGVRLLGAMAAVLTTAAIMNRYPRTFAIPVITDSSVYKLDYYAKY